MMKIIDGCIVFQRRFLYSQSDRKRFSCQCWSGIWSYLSWIADKVVDILKAFHTYQMVFRFSYLITGRSKMWTIFSVDSFLNSDLWLIIIKWKVATIAVCWIGHFAVFNHSKCLWGKQLDNISAQRIMSNNFLENISIYRSGDTQNRNTFNRMSTWTKSQWNVQYPCQYHTWQKQKNFFQITFNAQRYDSNSDWENGFLSENLMEGIKFENRQKSFITVEHTNTFAIRLQNRSV